MSPQALDEAVAKIRSNRCHDPEYNSDNSDEQLFDVEMTKTEALSQLLKSKGKTPVQEGETPVQEGETPVDKGTSPENIVAAVQSKRPRLTRRGSFFDDSDSDAAEANAPQNSLRRRNSENKENDVIPRAKKQAKSRQLNLSSSESESETSESESESVDDSDSPLEGAVSRKRTRENLPFSDNEECKPTNKCPKPTESDSESDSESENDDLVMDLNSPLTNTVDLYPLTTSVEDSNYDVNQPGSMETLAVSQSVTL